jgi:hypothetical protein
MKKSVNGKTFDEIFAERGEINAQRRLTRGQTYFYVHDRDVRNTVIFTHGLKKWRCSIPSVFLVQFSSGQVRYSENDVQAIKESGDAWKCGDKVPMSGLVFKATKNQIALLELYKSDK